MILIILGELWKEIFVRLKTLMKEHSVWKQKIYAYSAVRFHLFQIYQMC